MAKAITDEMKWLLMLNTYEVHVYAWESKWSKKIFSTIIKLFQDQGDNEVTKVLKAADISKNPYDIHNVQMLARRLILARLSLWGFEEDKENEYIRDRRKRNNCIDNLSNHV
jgi:uncharacterized protein YeeX (DUF496 family)